MADNKKRIVRNTPRTDRVNARILELLAKERLTGRQIAERLHMAYGGICAYLRKLQAEPRKVRICDYLRSGGESASIFELGSAPDAPYHRAKKVVVTQAEQRRKQILTELKEPKSVVILAARLGISETMVRVYLREFREEKLIFTARWEPSNGNPVPFYQAGKGENAPKPERRPRAEYVRRHKHKKTGWAAALVPSETPAHLLSQHQVRPNSAGPVQIVRRA
jgi:transcriptional regulator with XRE-family HTH domain